MRKHWKRRARILVAMLSAVFAMTAVGAASAVAADLRITKADSPDPVAVGSSLTYTIQVQNLGPETATSVSVTDRLPQGVDFISATTSVGQCTQKGRNVKCDLGSLGVETVNYSGTPTVTLSVIPRKTGTITNTVSVRGNQKDPVTADNRATATTLVVGPSPTCRGVPVTIFGTAGADVIVGTGGRDVIATFGGDDSIFSLAGRDLVCAGSGNDRIGAGSAADRVFGGAGRDRLLGRGGPDLLQGNAGNDVLKGGRGSDRLRGGSGFDRCLGGPGFDSIRGCER